MKIGDSEVVYTASLIIPEGEISEIKFNIGNWVINLEIDFIRETKSNSENEISLTFNDNKPRLTLINWSNSLGTATITPIDLGTASDGRKLKFMLSHWFIGGTSKLDIQFVLGVRK